MIYKSRNPFKNDSNRAYRGIRPLIGTLFLPFFVQINCSPPLVSEDQSSQTGGQAMTNEQKERITAMRHDGFGYSTIAKAVALTKDNVKAYCRSHDLAGVKAQSNTRIKSDQNFCQNCGKLLTQIPGRKKLKFCSAVCRQKWWNAHPEQVTRKAIYSFTCACCGNLFTAYGNAGRKYCGHRCYVTARFRGGELLD